MIPVDGSRISTTPAAHSLLVAAVLHGIGLLAGLALPAHDVRAQRAPAPGMFLVANRALRGSGFAESVILIVQHDSSGTMGLIVNQPTGAHPAELLPDVPGLDDFPGRLYIGGPVAAWGIIMLMQSAPAPVDAEHVFGDVYTSGNRELLDHLLDAGNFDADVRLYAGHSGWMPGQLDAEIRRGSWRVVPADAELVFSSTPLGVWKKLIGSGDRMIVDATGAADQKYTYSAMSPQMIPMRSGHFSSAIP